MKKFLLFCLFAFALNSSGYAQSDGRVERVLLQSTSLINSGGENPERHVSVYLPPNYDTEKNQHYPVIYYLHGFQNNDVIQPGMKAILDKGIKSGKIRPFILVIPDHKTIYEGSFYTNSTLTGNWADFTGKELVQYIDKNYRSIPHRSSRGIAGHSMGGYGAIKMAMEFPDVFSSLYALSPGLLAFVKEFGPNSPSFRDLQQIKSYEALQKTYYPRVLVAVARAWSPNPNKPPFFCDLPFTYENNELVVHQDILAKWEKNMPVYSVGEYAQSLRKMNAIKVDWGRNDAPRFPVQIGQFSQRLENLGIPHFAEEYIGDHGNKIWSVDGRVLNDLLPFFNDYLTF